MTKYCDNCGAEAQDLARFCMQCGTAFKPPTAPPEQPLASPIPEATSVQANTSSPTPAKLDPDAINSAQPVPGSSETTSATPPASSIGVTPPVEQIPVPPPLMNSVAAQQSLQNAAIAAVQPAQAGTSVLNEMLNNRYRIVRKLGEGGMGAVYLAEDTTLFNKQCIVKEMLPYYANQQEKEEAEGFFVREVQVLAGLRHPGIPQISDHFIISDHYYYVMEFVEGETLAQRAQRLGGRLNETETLEFARQITDVLEYISTRPEPVIHRDIKPDNLIVDNATGKVKLVDFGLAKAQNSRNQMSGKSSALGTPGYAPPEQYQGNAQPWSDVYALGATMHHLLSGVDPRNAATPFQFDPLRRIVPMISPRTEDVVRRMLEINPTARPTAKQLKQLLASGGLPAQPPPIGVVVQYPSVGTPVGIPGLPFNFRSGLSARNTLEISQACERSWDDGVYHLYQGDFEPWLQINGLHQVAQASLAIRQRTPDRNAGLEEFLHVLNPALPLPVLAWEPDNFQLGLVEKGGRHLISVEVSNKGRGYLYGTVRSLAPWLSVTSQRIGVRSGGKQIIQAEISTNQLNTGPIQASVLEIQSNGGTAMINLELEIIWPPRLKVLNEELLLGEIHESEKGKVLAKELAFRNDGGGVLQGEIQIHEPWMSLAPGLSSQFNIPSGQSITVQVLGNTNMIPAYQLVHGAVTIALPTGPVDIPVKMGVKKGIYELPQRILRWSGYLGFMMLAALSWSYSLALVFRWLIFGTEPIIFKVGTLANIYIRLYNSAYIALKLNPNSVPPDILASVLLLLLLIAGGVIFAAISRQFIRSLDEIELYYDRNLTTTYPQWQTDSRLVWWLRAAVFIASIACMWGNIRNEKGLIAGVIVGLLLAFFAVTPGYRPVVWQQLAVVLGMSAIGLILTESITLAALWGAFGFLLVPNLNSRQPLRWRWFQASFRPLFFAGIICLLAVGVGQVLWLKGSYPLDASYYYLPTMFRNHLIMLLTWLILGVGGYILALKTESLQNEPQGGLGRVFWVLFLFDALAGIVVFAVVRLVATSFHAYWMRWIIIALTVASSLARLLTWHCVGRNKCKPYWLKLYEG